MILVTVGNHVEPFDRLIEGMDALAVAQGAQREDAREVHPG